MKHKSNSEQVEQQLHKVNSCDTCMHKSFDHLVCSHPKTHGRWLSELFYPVPPAWCKLKKGVK